MQLSVIAFASLVLLSSALSLTVGVHWYFHQKMQQDLQMLGKVLAENSGAAVTFNDPKTAQNLLTSLRENHSIIAAALFQHANGKMLAGYPSSEAAAALATSAIRNGVWLQNDTYYTSVPVKVNEKHVGQLVLQSNLQEWQVLKFQLIELFAALIVVFVLLTLLESYWMKLQIIEPLTSLSAWATQVSQFRDFSARASKKNGDEIGHLVDCLNTMLEQLAQQETIVALNEELEREILERKHVEADLIEMRNRAEEGSKAKSRFLANMSHELRTPLNAIIGYSEMLQEILAEGEFEAGEISDDIEKVRTAGRHLLSLINDILDISKIEAGKMQISVEAFNMVDLVREVVDTLRPLAEEKCNKLVITGNAEPVIVHSDQIKVRQILFNMLSNAVKFTENGTVELIYSRVMETSGDWIVCRVRDTGIGISADSLKMLFKPFNQADPSTTRRFGGTGLGLAISRSYAEMLGGEISVVSEEGKGSEFCIHLPATATKTKAELVDMSLQEEAKDISEYRGIVEESLRILLIDDDHSVHDILRRQLARHHFVMASAFSGHEGLVLAKSQPFDVIVLDIFMPGLDGWQVLQILKSDETTTHLPVVMYTISSDKQKGFALGASDFLVKPINSQRLLSVLERYRAADHHVKVLLIDDDVHSQNLTRAYLEGPEWELLVAANGREGLACLDKNPNIRVILLDLIMPVMNGFQFLEAFNKRWPDKKIPVVVISARDLTNEERRLLAKHAEAVFCKGMFDRNTLLNCVLKILSEQQTCKILEDHNP